MDLMDIEKLIEDVKSIGANKKLSAWVRSTSMEAATALSALQAELTHKTELVRQQSNELERRDKLLKEQEAELEASLALLKEREATTKDAIDAANNAVAQSNQFLIELEWVKQEMDEAREVICAYCLDIPCKRENCRWYCGPEEG